MGLMVKEEEEKGRAGRETGRKRTHTNDTYDTSQTFPSDFVSLKIQYRF